MLRSDILVDILVEVLTENRRYEPDLFSTVDYTVPGLTLKHCRFVLKLGPYRNVQRLEWQELVKDWVHCVFLQWGRWLQDLEVKEGDLILFVAVLCDALEGRLNGLKRGCRLHEVCREFTVSKLAQLGTHALFRGSVQLRRCLPFKLLCDDLMQTIMLSEGLEADDGAASVLTHVILIGPLLRRWPILGIVPYHKGPALAQKLVEEGFVREIIHGHL